MAYVDPVTGQRTGSSALLYGTPWPKTREERHAMFAARWRAYRQEPYTDGDIKQMALFVAVDTSDRVTAVTQRIMRDYGFVCDVDAAAIATDGVTLGLLPGTDEAALATGRVEWDASRIDDRLPMWARNLCVDGLGYIEVFMSTDGPAIVWHQPTCVDVVMDRSGRTIERAIITIMEPPTPEVAADGTLSTSGQVVEYRRELTPTEIRAWRGGVPIPDETGPNTLGRVPLIRVAFADSADGSMPTNAAHGLDMALASINSCLMQIQTVGSRMANPLLAILGAQLPDGSDIQKQGKMLALPPNADIRWLELPLQSLRTLVEAAMSELDSVRQTMPEFLFVESGASASGTALSYRAGAFVAKIQPVRAAMYSALAEAVSLAAALRAGRPWAMADHVWTIDGGSALPMDSAAGAKLRTELMDAGLLRRADVVAWLQGARIAPQGIDPTTYATMISAEVDAAASSLREMVELAERMQGAASVADVKAAVRQPDADGPADDVPDMPDDSPDPAAA